MTTHVVYYTYLSDIIHSCQNTLLFVTTGLIALQGKKYGVLLSTLQEGEVKLRVQGCVPTHWRKCPETMTHKCLSGTWCWQLIRKHIQLSFTSWFSTPILHLSSFTFHDQWNRRPALSLGRRESKWAEIIQWTWNRLMKHQLFVLDNSSTFFTLRCETQFL